MGSHSDEDFDDLDDYLDDFADEILDKPYNNAAQENSNKAGQQPQQEKTKNDGLKSASEGTKKDSGSNKDEIPAEELSEEELSKQIDENMAALFGDSYTDPQSKEQLTALMNQLAENFDLSKFMENENAGVSGSSSSNKNETAKQPSTSDGTTTTTTTTNSTNAKPPTDFSKIISSTMSRLKEQDAKVDQSIKEEQNKNKSPEDLLAELLKEINLDGTNESASGNEDNQNNNSNDFDISKMLVEMVSQLTSKEVLYDSMKNLSVKFPKWLTENKDNLSVSAGDMERYKQQQKYIEEVVEIFEKPSYDDKNDNDREEISVKLEALQGAGLPPKELMDEFPNAGGLPTKGLPFNLDELNGSLPPDFADDAKGCEQQ